MTVAGVTLSAWQVITILQWLLGSGALVYVGRFIGSVISTHLKDQRLRAYIRAAVEWAAQSPELRALSGAEKRAAVVGQIRQKYNPTFVSDNDLSVLVESVVGQLPRALGALDAQLVEIPAGPPALNPVTPTSASAPLTPAPAAPAPAAAPLIAGGGATPDATVTGLVHTPEGVGVLTGTVTQVPTA